MIEIKNKLEKFLIGLSSLLLAVVFIMGFKIKSDSLGKEIFKEGVSQDVSDEKGAALQKIIEQNRTEIMNQIVNIPGKKAVETNTTITELQVPKTTVVEKKTSDKKTKSS